MGARETGRDQERVMSPFVQADNHLALGDRDQAGAAEKVAKNMAGLGALIAVTDLGSQQAVQGAGHERELQIAGHLHGHGRGKRVHVKKIHSVLDAVFDDHALSVAGDEPSG